DAVDQPRRKQPRVPGRVRTSAEWAFAYELLAGWQLDLAGPEPSRAEVEPAFATMERLRGRILLDELSRAGVAAPMAASELAERRAARLAKLTEAQQGLLRQDAVGRDELRHEVELAEAALAEVEDLAARNDPRWGPAPVATLGELQAALRDDEALLSFQLWRPDISLKAPYPVGASWLVVLTHAGPSPVRLAPSPL